MKIILKNGKEVKEIEFSKTLVTKSKNANFFSQIDSGDKDKVWVEVDKNLATHKSMVLDQGKWVFFNIWHSAPYRSANVDSALSDFKESSKGLFSSVKSFAESTAKLASSASKYAKDAAYKIYTK